MCDRSWNFEDAVARVRVGGTSSGTAFRVSETYVLTCKHVVGMPHDDRPAGDIQLVFKATGHTMPAEVVEEFWDNPYDIAVLVCREIPDAITQVRMAPSQNTKGHRISSYGYPLDTEGTAGDGIPATGEVVGHEGNGKIQVTSEQVCPGFSGAPLYDEGVDRVTGMLCNAFETSPEFSNRLANEAFAVAVETISRVVPELFIEPVDLDEKRQEATARLREVVVERLSQSPRAVEYLATAEERDASEKPDKRAEKVFDRLMSEPLKDVLGLFVRGLKRFGDRGDGLSTVALLQACECLIPASFDKDAVSRIHSAILQGQMFIEVPANVKTTVELTMAAVDGRKISFDDPTEDFPVGGSCINSMIELGINAPHALQTFEAGILQALRLPEVKGVSRTELINLRLRQLLENQDLRYYYVYSDDQLGRATIEMLAKEYPLAVFVKSTSPQDAAAEIKVLLLLQDIFAADVTK